jgi:hypothetical protein
MTNFNLKQYLTEGKLLQEIKVNKPGSLKINYKLIDQIYQESEDYEPDDEDEDDENPFPFGGVNNIHDIGPAEIPFDMFEEIIDDGDVPNLNELEMAALYLKIFDSHIFNDYHGSEEVKDVFNTYFPTLSNKKEILNWLKITPPEDLQEIKVNKPGVNFYFEQDESDDESYEYNDNQGGYYLFVGGGDEYLQMNSHLDDELGYDDMEGAPEIDENNPEEIDDLISFIEDIDPTFDTDELKIMINNFRKYKIPIYEFSLQGDGGYIFVSLSIRHQDILPYIKK